MNRPVNRVLLCEGTVMRIEFRIGLALNALGLVLGRFAVSAEPVTGFLCGICISLGIFFMAASLLSEKTYSKLLYRKWFAPHKG